MTEQIIRDAYCHIRTMGNTIPDDVLDFMLEASLEKLSELNSKNLIKIVTEYWNKRIEKECSNMNTLEYIEWLNQNLFKYEKSKS